MRFRKKKKIGLKLNGKKLKNREVRKLVREGEPMMLPKEFMLEFEKKYRWNPNILWI